MSIRTIHSEAMDLAENAAMALSRGEQAIALDYYQRALEKERLAANLAVDRQAPEPTRSILLKSAAHLATNCHQLRLAEQLISVALAGNPPDEIAEELRQMFEQVGFDRHLDLRGIQLQPNDVQMVLVGSEIAPGMAASEEFVLRIDTFQKLSLRTAESDAHLTYRERGDAREKIRKPLQLFVSVPRAASFAVSIRLAGDKEQGDFPFAESSVVLERLLNRLHLFDINDLDSLRREIPQRNYFENFVELATDLAPDGDRVRLVGFTATRDGEERRMEMTRPSKPSNLSAFVPPAGSCRKYGRVYFINMKDVDNPVLKLETEDGTDWRLKVGPDILQKAVRYAANRSRVIVCGVQITKTTLRVDELKAHNGRRPGKAKRRIAPGEHSAGPTT